jgi:hypothetical protein
MPGNAVAPLGADELERRLRAVDPAVVLVQPRILRRVIKRERKLPGIGLQVPHRKGYVIGREALLEIADPQELGLDGAPQAETLILLARVSPERLAAMAPGDLLTRYWRLLFHARVHLEFDRLIAAQRLTPARVRDRIHRIGLTEFEEIRTVLRQEDLLLPPRDDRSVYVEFAALYLELRYFARALLPRYFPAVHGFGCIDDLLAEDLDADALFAATRPLGAEDPVHAAPAPRAADGEEPVEPPPEPEPSIPSEARYHLWSERAIRVAAVGNTVKATILRARALAVVSPELRTAAEAAVEAGLNRLADRLRAALGLDAEQTREWRHVLAALMPRATGLLWPREARLLYDLQKVCIDHEREIFALDVVEWALSLGRRPIKRPLPGQPDILTLKHLRSALRRLSGARLPAATREHLERLLHAAIHHSETLVRERFQPRVEEAIREVGLRPRNLPERVALAKLTEELLDRVVERGFLSMGDLRDALSRNNLKLPDLAGPRQFLFGDQLIRANRRLAVALDGIYRRGEIYLRWLQRLSSAAFGTVIGRFLVLYVILPFGGSFVILEGVQHIIHAVAKLSAGQAPAPSLEPPPPAPGEDGDVPDGWSESPEPAPHVHSPIHLVHWYSLLLLGVFLLALLHVPPFRRAVGKALYLVYLGLKAVLVDLPAACLRLPAVRSVLDSRPFRAFRQFVLVPLLVAAPVGALLGLFGIDASIAGGLAAFLVAAGLLNTRAGRDLQEAVEDWLARTWHQVQNDIVPGLIRLVLAAFRWLLEEVERFLYAVDERLRFRTGEGRVTTVMKATLGVGWFFCTYLVRVGLNLFVEPTVNPIKHFPVVTVAAKLILPIIPALLALITAPLEPLVGRAVANMVATVAIFFLPGLAGFIVWELKENWRLYQANRPSTLRPVMIGHHGESMVRLLRPGFHSGTIPKLYARLRKAQRRGQRTGRWRTFHKHRESLAEVAGAVRHFIERELIALLKGSRSWGELCLEVRSVELSSNRVRIELHCPEHSDEAVWITFEELSGWLVAGLAGPGWLAALSREPVLAFEAALTGLYKMAGVDLVREQIRANLGSTAESYGLTEEGLVLWPPDGEGCEAVYPLRDGPWIEPRTSACPPPAHLPVLEADRLIFRRTPVTWQRWVEYWQRDQAGKDPPPDLLDAGVFLPVV